MGKSVRAGKELAAMSSDHSGSMPSSPETEAVSSKPTKDWIQPIDFEVLQRVDHSGDTLLLSMSH